MCLADERLMAITGSLMFTIISFHKQEARPENQSPKYGEEEEESQGE